MAVTAKRPVAAKKMAIIAAVIRGSESSPPPESEGSSFKTTLEPSS
jgi:hypothetical protein